VRACRILAHHARWAAVIRARADVDSFRVPVPFTYAWPKVARAAPMPRSSFASSSCSFFNNPTAPARLDIECPLAGGLYQSRCDVQSQSCVEEWSIRNIWIRSPQKRNSFPRSAYRARPDSRNPPYDISKTARIRSSLVRCES